MTTCFDIADMIAAGRQAGAISRVSIAAVTIAAAQTTTGMTMFDRGSG